MCLGTAILFFLAANAIPLCVSRACGWCWVRCVVHLLALSFGRGSITGLHRRPSESKFYPLVCWERLPWVGVVLLNAFSVFLMIIYLFSFIHFVSRTTLIDSLL